MPSDNGHDEEGFDSTAYWETRYATGRTSGKASRGLAVYRRAQTINRLIRREGIRSVVDWGCGDGYLLEKLRVPDYLGIDVSATAIGLNLLRFGGAQFVKWNPRSAVQISIMAELALSIDVIFHLVEPDIFDRYMELLIASPTRYLVVYADDSEYEHTAPHVKRRAWTSLIPHEHFALLHNPTDPVMEPWVYRLRSDMA